MILLIADNVDLDIGLVVQRMLMMMTSSIFPAKGPLGVAWVENANENTLEFPNKEAVWSAGILDGDRGETKTPEHPLLIAFCRGE